MGVVGMGDDPLRRYQEKRRFDRTPEPRGEVGGGAGSSFVVQKHHARSLHYDLRLEVDGVMASWAVPKGPSYDPKVKRLAVHVEDHPLDYRSFEGNIPGGDYGAGSVIVWDTGTYRNLTEHDAAPVGMREGIDNGHLSVWFDGTKLHGGWSLTRTRRDDWILVKRRDEWADASLDIEATEPASALTGRMVEDVAADPDAGTWTRGVATWSPPMLATLVDHHTWLEPSRPDWIFQRKFDGLRCVAVRNGDRVELWSRNHNSFSARFPDVVGELTALPIDNFTLDGELVGFDGGDFVGFGALQQRGATTRVVYCLFDVVHLLGRDTRPLPVEDRAALLRQAVEESEHVQLVPDLTGVSLADACAKGWEGLIAKRRGSRYVSDRSTDWVKLKCTAGQELVVGGWTEPKGTRVGLGALLVGYYDGDRLRYAGKVGTGFTAPTLVLLRERLGALATAGSPFAERITERGAHWVEPRMVVNVVFAEWTGDGRLRHPRFEGVREDKDPRSVVREQPH